MMDLLEPQTENNKVFSLITIKWKFKYLEMETYLFSVYPFS